MSLGSSMEVSASGLTAERLRLDVISNNLANADTTRGANGQPYRREVVTFEEREPGGFGALLAQAGGALQAGDGVEVASIQQDTAPYRVVHDPGNPDADKSGNVRLPNVNPILEMVDMISASHAYEMGVTAIDSAKQMQQNALNIGKA